MLSDPSKINWRFVQAVIFDMDGTLYSQRKVRSYMAIRLLKHAFKGGWRDIQVLSSYRRNMEKLSKSNAYNVSDIQYKQIANNFSVSEQYVSDLVCEWMDVKPLDIIADAAYPDIHRAFKILRSQGIKIGIFSDYPVSKKISALSLEVDAWCSSVDSDVGRLKPDVKGLIKIAGLLDVELSNCLMIGDRLDKDYACAAALKMPFLLRRGGDFFTAFNKSIKSGKSANVSHF